METRHPRISGRIMFHTPSVSVSDHEFLRSSQAYASTVTHFGCIIKEPNRVVKYGTKK
jgi:hypothetical protein